MRRFFNRFLHIVARFGPGARSLRPFLHKLRGVQIRGKVWIGDDVYLGNEYPEQIELQEGSGVGMRTTIIAHTRGKGRVIVEEDAYISPGCVLVCPADRVIRIGSGSLIGPGCVITSSVPPDSYMATQKPTKIARSRTPFAKAASLQEFMSGLEPVSRRSAKPACHGAAAKPENTLNEADE